ncbi:hypothetical protein ABL840_16820 [Variovorax sp. NFACC27]|uniref:hypothetical protein n=1 Tax=unclassified Variovorax TaxID=663243 RepID=UPI00089D3174|nr:hypothetical protein [Variovorax paradoxus]SEF27796.1 hypothetical protein SAMN03159371_03177 [Variovorax sp. NFACC28]SEG72056.1 hypothetical protein SAMN03159365_03348 [Variovorax sp. NFACC29]SFC78986.1 hypothetical protein SAMN03159379_03146 [Variovorax sp. NFACC26]SFG00027.1 hypothetical protein SAMN03159447_01345 [Variovorax sp. NFACC27]
MRKINNLVASALVGAAGISSAHAADPRYPIAYVQTVKITLPSHRSAWENKDFLDCDDVVLTEEDVRYALRRMRRVLWRGYDPEKVDTTGCEGEAFVTFKNGRILAMGIEPTGRIATAEYDAKMKVVAGSSSFYECHPCRDRKMTLLKDALNRADERRLKKLVAEGRLSASEAEFRLKRVRDERDKP